MSLKTVIDKKNRYLDKISAQFEADFDRLSGKIQRMLVAMIKEGNLDREALRSAFMESYEPLANKFINDYRNVYPYIRGIAAETGIAVTLPEASLAMIQLYEENNIAALLNATEPIIDSMGKAALKFYNEGPRFGTLVKGLEEERLLKMRVATLNEDIDELLRLAKQRVAAEANTGLAIYERGIRDQQYKAADIERFTYIGPLDQVTRDECRQVMEDPRNETTGFTRQEILELPVDMNTGGGYNCRHSFYPFVEI